MNRARLPYRRILLPAALAMILAAETIAVSAATDLRAPAGPGATAAFASQATRPGVREGVSVTSVSRGDPGRAPTTRRDPRARAEAPVVDDVRVAAALPVRPPTAAVNKAKTVSKVTVAAAATSSGTSSGGSGGTRNASYSGRNHMWFPALGINRSVTGFACTSSAYPGDRVYRWGCAGANNVYLFGHAHSVFKPLHDAYVRGRLQKGMKVMYADGSGKVSTYRIAWWKVTTPTNGAFAYAAQSRPSMTLQTCVGARSQYRLIVRLVRV
jgi:hypothetical protein